MDKLKVINYIVSWIKFLFLHCFFLARQPPQWARASSLWRFIDYTQRRTTFDRTPLDKWSARGRVLYLTILTTDRHPCPQWDSNKKNSASEQQQTYALDRLATGTDSLSYMKL